jgi:hypothetical protein
MRKLGLLTQNQEHSLRVFGNRVLRRMFIAERDIVMGGWLRLHSEGVCNLCASPDVIRMIKSRMCWVEHVAYLGV